ncbi:sensor histidine kinase [Defluviitalea phaphyphila]|uniref:sensor histidine kinase n=1 Tax=Defluviitalea phaphyphila TaxID=1473580 RepID=UPI001FA6DC3A|nr:HAMP domain-containing sensor histidine kinase [Defluviitalea phaphyphila]
MYLEKYYISQKKNLLEETKQKINELFTEDIESIAIDLEIIENTTGTSIIIFNRELEIKYASFPRAGNRQPFIITKNNPNAKKQNPFYRLINSMESSGKDSIFRIEQDPELSINFLEFISFLDSKDILLLRVPIASMSESANIANNFFMFTGILLLALGAIWAYIFSKKFTKPILEINKVANHVANLDFSHEYIAKSNDELGTLSKSINELSKKLDYTITELNKKNERLKIEIEKERHIDKMRKEFISNVSHELKTPIALIQGYAEGLKENIIEDKENKDFYCEVIIDEANKMNKLVKDLLNLSQLESGFWKLERKDFELKDFIYQVLNKYKTRFEEKGVNLKLHDIKPILVNGDIIRIEQVLINYINNALDHLDVNKILEIKVEVKDEHVRVSVFNSGKHIPKEALNEIWTSFYKVDSARTREYGGSGLGLSIVKAIQELHNNKFGVENIERGVLFWFDLDKAKNPL